MVEENDSASGAATLPLHSRTNGKYSQMEDDQPAGTSNQQQVAADLFNVYHRERQR